MTIEQWLEDGKSDAYRRKLPELADLLEGLARGTAALRAADWNDDAAGDTSGAHREDESVDPSLRMPPVGAGSAIAPRSAMPVSGPSITSLAPRLASGELRAEQLTEEALDTIRLLNPRLNAFIAVAADAALAHARQCDQDIAAGRHRGPLHGIPISIKDLIDIGGLPTTAASRLREGHVARRDAPIVTTLRRAGAVLVGKTNLHEFAFGTTSEDSGWGPVRHPDDDTRSPGGSSGGSAVAVRTGMSVASIGTDTGGSIRIPAGACGIVGLKPGWGEISADGVVPLSRQLDHVGPLARSVPDAALLYDILRGEPPASADEVLLSDLRLAVLDGYFLDRLSEAVESGVMAAFDAIRRGGARVCSASIPHAREIGPVYLHLVLPDAAAYHASALERRPHAYTDNVRIRLEMGRHILAEDYARAVRGRVMLRREVDRALGGVDALLLPALAIEAPPIGTATVPVRGGTEVVRTAMLRCTQLFNVTGHPAISIPCGTTRAGLPIGLQMVGHAGRTADLRLADVNHAQRVVRPFEWGLDWLPVNGHPRDAAPDQIVRSWIDGVMKDTDAFFTPPASTSYRFIESAPELVAATGNAGTLTFPSALTTPHAENNIVYGRLFRARDKKRAVVVLPQWNSDEGGHIGLSRLLARVGVTALRLSLPYHDRRMPPELGRADYIVSPNIARTVQVCRQAVLDTRQALWWLRDQGYERLGLLGTSLGSCLAMLTAAHEPLVRAQALNHVSPFFADVVWRGLSTAHVRSSLDGHIELERLRDLWRPISPWSFLERARGKKTLLVYAKYDLTFPVDLSIKLLQEFRRLDIPTEVAVLPCGHYTTGRAPFKFLDGYYLARFLTRNL
jgi:aspartyl-tRNA(Asn)/glutamyl-tRNA(Gln) amidotransferase subunit A